MNKIKITTLLLAFFLVFSMFTSSAFAVEFGGIGGKPAYPRDDDPKTQSTFVHNGQPGQSIDDAVLLANNTADVKTLQVYATDPAKSSDGSFSCKQMVEPKEGVGAWITLDKNEVTLQPHTTYIDKFVIKIPATANVAENLGCIAIQEKSQIPQISQNGIALSFRTAIKVSITIPGEIRREISISDFKFDLVLDSKFFLQAAFKNSGTVSTTVKYTLSVVNQFGYALGPEKTGEVTILRGENYLLNLDTIRPFWGGFFKVKYSFSYVNPTKEDPNAVVSQSGESDFIFVAPQAGALAIYSAILIILIALIVYILLKRRQIKHIKTNWVEYTVQGDDDLNKLATKAHISWMKLAHVNNIKPPYELVTGMVIKIPPFESKTSSDFSTSPLKGKVMKKVIPVEETEVVTESMTQSVEPAVVEPKVEEIPIVTTLPIMKKSEKTTLKTLKKTITPKKVSAKPVTKKTIVKTKKASVTKARTAPKPIVKKISSNIDDDE